MGCGSSITRSKDIEKSVLDHGGGAVFPSAASAPITVEVTVASDDRDSPTMLQGALTKEEVASWRMSGRTSTGTSCTQGTAACSSMTPMAIARGSISSRSRIDQEIANMSSQDVLQFGSLGRRPTVLAMTDQVAAIDKDVGTLLNGKWLDLKNSSLLGTWRDRDKLIRSCGPQMMLVDPETMRKLGRIPHSSENLTVSLEDAASIAAKANKRFFIEMFSHCWHSCYQPDDTDNIKAKVLLEWAKYRADMNFSTFFWIDYSCIDQADIAPGVSMLPLYVSCCNNILCFDTPAYETRAWCRLERLMFSSFVAPNNEFIDPQFKYNSNAAKTDTGELIPAEEDKALVPDPCGEDAELSYESDKMLIEHLRSLCAEHWSRCWKDGLLGIVEQKVGLKEVGALKYGSTELRMRKFDAHVARAEERKATGDTS